MYYVNSLIQSSESYFFLISQVVIKYDITNMHALYYVPGIVSMYNLIENPLTSMRLESNSMHTSYVLHCIKYMCYGWSMGVVC